MFARSRSRPGRGPWRSRKKNAASRRTAGANAVSGRLVTTQLRQVEDGAELAVEVLSEKYI
jgi:hypothetical protein